MNLKEQVAIQRMYDGQVAAAEKPGPKRQTKAGGADIPPVQDLPRKKKKASKKSVSQ